MLKHLKDFPDVTLVMITSSKLKLIGYATIKHLQSWCSCCQFLATCQTLEAGRKGQARLILWIRKSPHASVCCIGSPWPAPLPSSLSSLPSFSSYPFCLGSLEYLMKPCVPQTQPHTRSARPKTLSGVLAAWALPTVVRRTTGNLHTRSNHRYFSTIPHPHLCLQFRSFSSLVLSNLHSLRRMCRYNQLSSLVPYPTPHHSHCSDRGPRRAAT